MAETQPVGDPRYRIRVYRGYCPLCGRTSLQVSHRYIPEVSRFGLPTTEMECLKCGYSGEKLRLGKRESSRSFKDALDWIHRVEAIERISPRVHQLIEDKSEVKALLEELGLEDR